ncbi:hypothetical protein ACFUIW_36500 [Streptomyces sp. NPDC057245]|uniref:hypothetical protein n=1 Tax=Streptomyces sp. NPDC057245 TaxID=3346065 RepID=UPI00362A94DC
MDFKVRELRTVAQRPRPATTSAGRTAYPTSKLAAIYLIHEYARRLPTGIDAAGCNPGLVPGTGLTRNAGPVARFAMRRVMPATTLTPFATSHPAPRSGRCLTTGQYGPGESRGGVTRARSGPRGGPRP